MIKSINDPFFDSISTESQQKKIDFCWKLLHHQGRISNKNLRRLLWFYLLFYSLHDSVCKLFYFNIYFWACKKKNTLTKWTVSKIRLGLYFLKTRVGKTIITVTAMRNVLLFLGYIPYDNAVSHVFYCNIHIFPLSFHHVLNYSQNFIYKNT